MTKLNHNRPYLRFIDNLRRELKHMETGSLPAGYGATPKSAAAHATGQTREIALCKAEAGLALDLLNALDAYVEASSDVVSTLSPGAKRRFGAAKKIQCEAEEKLLAVATKTLAQMFLSKSSGDSNFLDWYSQLETRFDGEGGEMAWDILNNFAMKHAIVVIEKTLDS
jgi:hypothetical protein